MTGLDGPSPTELLALAARAALAAGRLLAARPASPAVVGTKSSPTDVVTEMDQAAEQLIREVITASRPSDAILGEEGGQTGGGAPVRWIVDPLDGTVNYLYGLPDWAVSVAAEVGGEVVAGVVCAPRRDEMYGAVLGDGAWCASVAGMSEPSARAGLPDSARPLVRTADVPLERALIGTGFGYEPARRRVQGRVVAEILPQVRDIRRNGAAALDLCALAAGHLDGYYERGLHYWDIAAGSLIAREAGAVVGGLAGRPPGPSMTIGAGPLLFTALTELLAGLDPERDD